MRASALHIIFIAFLFAACDKATDGPPNLLNPAIIKSYDDENVFVLTDATAGDGVVLLTYLTEQNFMHFKLITNNCDEVWTIATDLTYVRNSRQYVLKVIFEEDGLITVFYGTWRLRYNMDGEEVSREEGFVQIPWSLMDIRNILLGPNGEYLIMGGANIGGSRAAILAIDRDGNPLFNFIYTITSNGGNCYTGGMVLDDGSYLFAGTYRSPLPTLSNAYFITKLDASGNELWTVNHITNDFHGTPSLGTSVIPGRDLIRTNDGNFLYLIDGWGTNTTQRIVRFNEDGEEVAAQQVIDFTDVNQSYGNPPFIGTVIAEHANGSIYGVGNSNTWSLIGTSTGIATLNYAETHFSYFYTFSITENTWNAAFLDRNFSNYLTSATRLSNGKVMLAGTILSLGADVKIIVSIK